MRKKNIQRYIVIATTSMIIKKIALLQHTTKQKCWMKEEEEEVKMKLCLIQASNIDQVLMQQKNENMVAPEIWMRMAVDITCDYILYLSISSVSSIYCKHECVSNELSNKDLVTIFNDKIIFSHFLATNMALLGRRKGWWCYIYSISKEGSISLAKQKRYSGKFDKFLNISKSD